MRVIAILAVLALLPGCIKTRIVKVEVSVPCLKAKPAKPVYAFGRGDAPASSEAVKILARDFEAADRYGTEWEGAAAGCILLTPAN